MSTLKEAQRLVEQLAPHVGMFKVGLELLTAEGAPKVVAAIQRAGGPVFYDGKFDDIPNTTGKASKAVSSMEGVAMFNVHASSGIESVKAAVANKGDSMVLAVTVLTSIGEEECEEIYGYPTASIVWNFIKLAAQVGCDGVICSPKELDLFAIMKTQHDFAYMSEEEVTDELHEKIQGLIKVIPGTRSEGADTNDQKRVMTPKEAMRAGADYLVIGRQITNARYRIEAAKAVAEEIAEGLAS